MVHLRQFTAQLASNVIETMLGAVTSASQLFITAKKLRGHQKQETERERERTHFGKTTVRVPHATCTLYGHELSTQKAQHPPSDPQGLLTDIFSR